MVFFLIPVMQFIPFTRAQSINPTPKIELNYDQIYYNLNYFEDINESVQHYAVGEYEEYDGIHEIFYEEDGFWIKEERSTLREYNYSSWSDVKVTGNLSLGISMDAYSVDVTYGDDLHLNWMAVKNGTIGLDYFITYHRSEGNITIGHHDVTNITYTKYDLLTHEFIETWDDFEENSVVMEDYSLIESDYTLMHISSTTEFTAPVFLVTQVYKTVNNESVAWSDLFWEYFIYEDVNFDSIYSLQGSSMYYGEEFRGFITPWAMKRTEVVDKYYADKTMDKHFTSTESAPKDKDFMELTKLIKVKEPEIDGSVINWGIEYPEYPAQWYVGPYDNSITNASYNSMSPANYSYEVQYAIADGEADFDYTIDFPKITDQSFYDAVQKKSISLPHYTYFISASETKDDGGDISVPMDQFNFDINDSTIAEITMVKKKEYQVSDYPAIGVNTITNSSGGSVSNMLKYSIGSTFNIQSNNPMHRFRFTTVLVFGCHAKLSGVVRRTFDS